MLPQARSVGNSAALKHTALVEAFNLRASVELMLGNPAGKGGGGEGTRTERLAWPGSAGCGSHTHDFKPCCC